MRSAAVKPASRPPLALFRDSATQQAHRSPRLGQQSAPFPMDQWLKVVFHLLVVMKARVNSQDTTSLVNVTFIENAEEKGSVCLDGSPGAYYFASGFGNGENKWIVYLQGGGWCNSKYWCLERSRTRLGSTKNASATHFGTILSPNHDFNPDFYNWNRVYILYCDGASFMADVEAVDPETKLYFRGRRIFGAVMEELIENKGMADATNALLVGNSAGGLAAILNCDRFHSYIPCACRVKCFSDSGFFIHAKDLPGAAYRENYYANVITFHELTKFLPEPCRLRMSPSLCLFPENVVGDIKTPLFLLNSNVDKYQISNNLKPDNPIDEQGWKNCTQSFTTIQNCTTSQLQLIKDFQSAFLRTLERFNDDSSRGLFINSCFIHDFVSRSGNWRGIPTLHDQTVAEALSDWYFERGNVQLIDNQHHYPINCNATGLHG